MSRVVWMKVGVDAGEPVIECVGFSDSPVEPAKKVPKFSWGPLFGDSTVQEPAEPAQPTEDAPCRAPWAPEPQEPRAGTFAARLLRLIRRAPGLTSTEIARIFSAANLTEQVDKSPSAVSAAAGRLREAGLVVGTQTWCRTRERKAIGWFPREVTS